MEYESLYKIKYKFPAEYDSIYQTRFHGEDVIHLDFEINDNPAFICQPSEMWKMIVQIHKEDKNIRAMRQSLPGVALHQFTTRCLVDELVLTNDIEGVNSTRREIHEVIEKSNIPLAAPSANISTKPSGTCIEDIKEDFEGKVTPHSILLKFL